MSLDSTRSALQAACKAVRSGTDARHGTRRRPLRMSAGTLWLIVLTWGICHLVSQTDGSVWAKSWQNWQSYCKHRDIKRSAEQFLQRLKPISVALDLIQKDSCTIADAAEIWKTLKTNQDAKKIFQKTYWKVESQWTGENPKQIAWHQRLFVSFSKCWLLQLRLLALRECFRHLA